MFGYKQPAGNNNENKHCGRKSLTENKKCRH